MGKVLLDFLNNLPALILVLSIAIVSYFKFLLTEHWQRYFLLLLSVASFCLMLVGAIANVPIFMKTVYSELERFHKTNKLYLIVLIFMGLLFISALTTVILSGIYSGWAIYEAFDRIR